jgi:hypothetical protein
LSEKVNKFASFYVIFAFWGIEFEVFCVYLHLHSAKSAKDILLDSHTITTVEIRANLHYWDCNPNGRSFPIFEGGLW